MDGRAPKRPRQALPRLVMSSNRGAALVRAAAIAAVAFSLLGGIAGGLTRAGVLDSGAAANAVLGHAAVSHAMLMICGVFGTVIAVERAVASRLRYAFIAPLTSALGSVSMLSGQFPRGAWLLVTAAVAFVLVSLVLIRRQFAAHTSLLALGSLCWLIGNLCYAVGADIGATVTWWFAFLVLTIVAERLEMTRLLPQRVGARASLLAALVTLLAGAFATGPAPLPGGLLYGAALSLLALWLGTFDIARRTVLARGLSRYIALCLLCGYAWLFIAGLAWGATAMGWPARDIALHAIGLGFIFSMVMGHAPIILPAIAHIKLQFGRYFYGAPLVLHLSLGLRLVGGAFDERLRTIGATFNAVAIALFALTIAAAAVAWHIHRIGAARSQEVLS